MDPSTSPEATAAAILRPALLLWLVDWLVRGASEQVFALWTRGVSEPSDTLWLWWGVVNQVLFVAVVIWFVRRDRDASRVFRKPRPRVVELCVVVSIAASLLLVMWQELVPTGSNSTYWEREVGWPLPMSLLSSAVIPAVFEELMYRGLLLQRFARVFPLGFAIALQAMMFAAAHYDPVGLLPLFVFGAVAGILRTAADALWPCMLMHLVWNGWIVLEVYEVI